MRHVGEGLLVPKYVSMKALLPVTQCYCGSVRLCQAALLKNQIKYSNFTLPRNPPTKYCTKEAEFWVFITKRALNQLKLESFDRVLVTCR